MIIKELFKKPIDRNIQGVVTIGNEEEEQKWQELEEYVCTDELIKHFRRFFGAYARSIANPTEKMAAWITGYFGSGKSHFLKILGYILENKEVAGVKPVAYFKDKIKDELILADMNKSASANNKVVLFNIDSKAPSDAKNKSQAIMEIMLKAFNESVGYCGSLPWVADLERTLDEEGLLDAFIAKFEELSNRDWKSNRSKAMLVRKNIVDALVEVRGVTREDANAYVNDQINNYTNSTEDFAKIVNDYCEKNKARVIFLIDEVGQFIGVNTQLMLNLQTCVEDLGKYCRGKAWVVVTSQQELTAMINSNNNERQDFSKIQARFEMRLLLSGAEAGEVIKKRILDKKDNAVTPLKSLYDGYQNKISNLIVFSGAPSWSGYKDADEFKDVYPFVPYQFELLQKVFTSVREHGMSGGKHLAHSERSLLGAFQESAKKYANCETNILVPFDSFYNTLEQFIDYDVKMVFSSARKKNTISEFDLRVLTILFMILYVKEMPSTIDRIATLMISSLNEDKLELKKKIENSLKILESETFIQKNGDEYDFLTNKEQDINKQINNVSYNEGEIKKNIRDIIYDKIFENTKFRYKNRYDFSLNRYVDDELKGNNGQDNINIKIMTRFSNLRDSMDFASESTRSNALIVDLVNDDIIDELIKANKIAIYKRNNSATMDPITSEILTKKNIEASSRMSRAENKIKELLRTAPMYYNGSDLHIKQNDGKDRLNDALSQVVTKEYFKLDYVSYYYQDAKAIREVLDSDSDLYGNDLSADANSKAYNEIFDKIKNDKNLRRTTTVKNLIDYFARIPYGWRDLDVLGMVAKLLKVDKLYISIHGNIIDVKDYSFKTEYGKKNDLDKMVVSMHENVDSSVLYNVKQIMNQAYGISLTMNESSMKNDVLDFFNKKKQFLSDLKMRYGNNYAGVHVVPDIYRDFEEISKTNDSSLIFNEIINREGSLIDNAEKLEQIENFYKEGSNQQKVYKEAQELVNWYDQNNTLINNLSDLDDIIAKITEILNMELPFSKINDLQNLVFNASGVKDKILVDKYNEVKNTLDENKKEIDKELNAVLNSSLSDYKKEQVQDRYNGINDQYNNWNNLLSKDSKNLNDYVFASQETVRKFKELIADLSREEDSSNTKKVRRKSAKLVNYVPVAKRTIKTKDDIDSVIESIKASLEDALSDNDEVILE